MRLAVADSTDVAGDADLPLTRDPCSRGPSPELLLAAGENAWFRDRWHELEAAFGDEPRRVVAAADELAAQVLERLASTFAAERDASVPDLRRFRSFFERVLAT